MSRRGPAILMAMAAITAALVFMAPCPAGAAGIGVFVATGTGDSKIRPDGEAESRDTIDISGFGLVLDTNLSMDRAFNYRLELGAGKYGSSDSPYNSIVMVHDFGFSIARIPTARLWLGPEVMLNLIDDSSAAQKPRLFGFGMGLAMGANILLTNHTCLSIKAAYISQTLTGHIYINGVEHDITTEDYFGYTGLSFLIRFGERY